MLGYALALFAWLREEARTPWASYLRPDPYAAFRQGRKYLEKTADSMVQPGMNLKAQPWSCPIPLIACLGIASTHGDEESSEKGASEAESLNDASIDASRSGRIKGRIKGSGE